MKKGILLFSALFLCCLFCSSALTAQSACQSMASGKVACSVEKKEACASVARLDLTDQAPTAASTSQADNPAMPVKTVGLQSVKAEKSAKTLNCDPTLCDPTQCDPRDCDPSKCDPSNCDLSKCVPKRSVRATRI